MAYLLAFTSLWQRHNHTNEWQWGMRVEIGDRDWNKRQGQKGWTGRWDGI